jgi:hypothetical protein
VGVVRTEGNPLAQQVAGHVVAAVGAVLAGVGRRTERPRDPEAGKGLAGDDVAAGAQVGRQVQV